MRGVTDYSKVFKFFKPTIDKLYDPMLMKGCDIATQRILQCIDSKEKVMVLGDYDVDGIIGASMFSLFLKHNGIDVSCVYILTEYTRNTDYQIVQSMRLMKKVLNLLVAIDCGITATNTVDYANEKGIDIIICDHHQPPEHIAECFCIMDPIQKRV